VDGQQALIISIVILVFIDATLFVLAFTRFQRSKMYLD
jgi:hypothetical protein